MNQLQYRIVVTFAFLVCALNVDAEEPPVRATNQANAFNEQKVNNIKDSTTRLFEEAKQALTQQQYPLAISLLNKLYLKGDDEKKAFALEFLGVAKERSFKYAFAKQYYQRCLKEYPNATNSKRVKQRLSALIGIQEMTAKKTLKSGSGRRSVNENFNRGSLATDYRQSDLVNDLGEKRQTLSLWGVDLDARGNRQTGMGKLDYRFSGGHFQDLTDDGSGTNDRLRYANVGWESEAEIFTLNIGRQRSRGKGLFNRFDGLLMGYRPTKKQKLNLVLGSPVASSKVLSLDPERNFIGLSYDWEDLFANLDTSFFVLHQSIGDLTDRQAVGGEVRYFSDGISIFSLLDYDIFYSELNAFLLSGSYTSKSKTRYHLSYNQRKSPYISTRNALIGQPADSLEELQNLFITDEEILDLAVDRTLESKTASFQLSQPINENYEISGNITSMNLSGAPASGGIAEIESQGSQLYFNLYLRGSKIYSNSDNNQIGIRNSKLTNSDVNSVYATSQYRFSKLWDVNVKLRYDDRKNDNGTGQQSLSPSLRLQFKTKAHYFYADLGAIFFTNQIAGLDDLKTDIYYTYLGYRFFF